MKTKFQTKQLKATRKAKKHMKGKVGSMSLCYVKRKIILVQGGKKI